MQNVFQGGTSFSSVTSCHIVVSLGHSILRPDQPVLAVASVTPGVWKGRHLSTKKSLPRDFRIDDRPYWSKKLANLLFKLSKARQRLERNSNPGNTTKHNGQKEEFIKIKTSELQQSWHEKTSSLSLETSSGKLYHFTKVQNDDVRRRRGATVLEEDNTFRTGK